MKPRIAVLLSTYNGEAFLPELLDSLKKQNKYTFDLIWRDDLSSDNTVQFVSKYGDIRQERCVDFNENIGPGKSFFHLLEHAREYDFVFFCDQDDIWDANKIAIAVESLVKSDCDIYGSKVRIFKKNKIWPTYEIKINPTNAIYENVLIGCTIALSRKFVTELLKYKLPNHIQHDHWIYICGSIFSKIYFDNSAHISYRLHPLNNTGLNASKSIFSLTTFKRFSSFFRRRKTYEMIVSRVNEISNQMTNYENSDIKILVNSTLTNRIKIFRKIKFRQSRIENIFFGLMWVVKFI